MFRGVLASLCVPVLLFAAVPPSLNVFVYVCVSVHVSVAASERKPEYLLAPVSLCLTEIVLMLVSGSVSGFVFGFVSASESVHVAPLIVTEGVAVMHQL